MDFKSILLGVIVGGLAGVFVTKRLLEEELQEAIDEERRYLRSYYEDRYSSRSKVVEEEYEKLIDEYKGVENVEDINEEESETIFPDADGDIINRLDEYEGVEDTDDTEYVDDDVVRFIDEDEYYENEEGATVIFYYREDAIYTTYEKTKMPFSDVEGLVGEQAMETIAGTVRTLYLYNSEVDKYILLEGLDKSFVDSVLKQQG